MDSRRILALVLWIVCLGVPLWLWWTHTRSDPSPPTNPGLAFGEKFETFAAADDLDQPVTRDVPVGPKGLVIFFWQATCPAVQAVHPRFEALVERYQRRGFEFLVLDGEPQDPIDDIKSRRDELKATYEVVRDFQGKAARQLGVSRAATFLVFDNQRRLVYRGAFDDGLRPPQTGYVHEALSAVLASASSQEQETKAPGCVYSHATP